MTSIAKHERGFSIVETSLLVIVIAAIGVVGWYVYSHRSKSNPAIPSTGASTISSTSSQLSSGTSNADLQSDLNNVTSSSNQTNQDISASNSSLNDQSTFTSVPQ